MTCLLNYFPSKFQWCCASRIVTVFTEVRIYTLSQRNTMHALVHRIVLSVHAPTEDKIEDVKNRFYEELESVFDTKIMLGDFNS
jgi:hypothetical protein